jgi:hypothetical protein
VDEGIETIQDALALVRSTSRTYFWESELHRIRGVLLLQVEAGDGNGELILSIALELARRVHSPLLELRAAVALADVCVRRGEHSRAWDLLTPLRSRVSEGADTPDLQRADRILAEASTGPVE